MSDAIEEEFRRIDEILSQALEAFRVAEVDQRLFGSAFPRDRRCLAGQSGRADR